MDVIRTIAKNIHDIRIEKNISLLELAEKTNIDINIIRKLGTGRCPVFAIPLCIKVAEGLGVNFGDITKGIEFVED